MNWMNLPEQYTTNAYYAILPVEYENKPTFGEGARNGPSDIIQKSSQLDYYDSWYETEPYKQGISILSMVRPETPEDMIETLSDAPKKEGFTIALGGDHAITVGLTKGYENIYDEFDYLCFDAHADYWHSWKGSQFNHACVSKRVSENHTTLLSGVRTMDKDEHELIKDDDTMLIRDEEFSKNIFQEKVAKLQNNVYISIDVDVLNPALISSTGTPEPGGLTWYELLNALEYCFKSKNVIGIDIVEFAPKGEKEGYFLAKLCNKTMALENVYG